MSNPIAESVTEVLSAAEKNVRSMVSETVEQMKSSKFPFLKGINFEWCGHACSAELALSPTWSCSVAVKSYRADLLSLTSPSAPAEGSGSSRVKETVSLEARKYFDSYGAERRAFVSTRIGTSRNIGAALGLQLDNPYRLGGLSLHVGAYTNMKSLSEVKPTVGLSFSWSY